MSAPVKTNEIDPLLPSAQVAKLLGVSTSWLAKSRLNGTGPRFRRRCPEFTAGIGGTADVNGLATQALPAAQASRAHHDWARATELEFSIRVTAAGSLSERS